LSGRSGARARTNPLPRLEERSGPSFNKPFLKITLALGSGLLFFLAHPNELFPNGLWPLAFIALLPYAVLVRLSGWRELFLYSLLHTLAGYGLYNAWLASFDALALPFVLTGLSLLQIPLAYGLKLASLCEGSSSYLLQCAVLAGFELARSYGFLAYPYGFLGYALAPAPPLLGLAKIGGVYAVSAFAAMPSFALSGIIAGWIREGTKPSLGAPLAKALLKRLAPWAALLACSGILWLIPMTAEEGSLSVALIQHNADPHKVEREGLPSYRENFRRLRALSDEAAKADPGLLLWSETAFVPSTAWHRRYRSDARTLALVEEFLSWQRSRGIALITGSTSSELDASGELKQYNAAILYRDGSEAGEYRKVKLVPFSEHFPYGEAFPWFLDFLKRFDVHLWEPGPSFDCIELDGVKLGTPICYEDGFPWIARAFVEDGASLLLNLTNDTWSYSLAAERQHLAFSVLRAVETGRAFARSANGGISCLVLPDGRVDGVLPPFEAAWGIVDAPLMRGTTPYAALGDLPLLASIGLGGACAALKGLGRKKRCSPKIDKPLQV
jgi:apolipoprotein N-acyltransferase